LQRFLEIRKIPERRFRQEFPVFSLLKREIAAENGSLKTAPSAILLRAARFAGFVAKPKAKQDAYRSFSEGGPVD
jgi:hypothetical protein